MNAESRIVELGLEIPPTPPLGGNYSPVVIVGDMCYVSGQGPLLPSGEMLQGKVGSEISQEEGYQAARQVALAMLATLKANIHSLNPCHTHR